MVSRVFFALLGPGVILQQYHWPFPTASKRSFFFKCVIHTDQLLLVELRSNDLRLQHFIVDHAVLILPNAYLFAWMFDFEVLVAEIIFTCAVQYSVFIQRKHDLNKFILPQSRFFQVETQKEGSISNVAFRTTSRV